MQDGKHVILCIDDDEDVRLFLRAVLDASGYVFVGAETAEEGVRKYKDCQPDLIIVDLMMEEVDAGTNFVKELRLLGNQIPVFMLSSVGDNLSQMTDYSGLGLAGVLQKPVGKEHLLTVIRQKLG